MARPPDQTAQTVRRRRVFYIPGFDPFPARRYRELYRREGAAQDRLPLTLEGAGRQGWTITATPDGADPIVTEMTVLTWSDIVRDGMSNGIWQTYGQMLRTAWIYLASGALWRLARLRQGPVVAALYPVVMLLGQLALALGAGALVWRLGQGSVPVVALLLVALAVVWGLLRAGRALDHRLYAYYLMHDYAFSAQAHGATPAALRARLADFAEQIRAALADDVDEVLVVGHSSGAHLGVQVLAQLMRETKGPVHPALSFLSLGQVVPMVSFLPRAGALRQDLHDLAASDRLTWVDVTAPSDACCFALCDPVAVSGAAPDHPRGPLVISAQLRAAVTPDRWRALRRRYFQRHFLYLCALDHPKGFDYFEVTAGPLSLATRYAEVPPSPSRISHAVSGHRGRGA